MKRWMAAALAALAVLLVLLNLALSTPAAGAQSPSPSVLDALRTKSAIDALATANALGAAQQAASDQAAAQAAAAQAAQSSARATQTAIALSLMLNQAQQTVQAASLAATVQYQETQTALQVQATQTRAALEYQQTRAAMQEADRLRTATAQADERNVQATTTRQAAQAAYQEKAENTVYGAAIIILLVIVVGTIYVGSRLASTLAAWANHLRPADADHRRPRLETGGNPPEPVSSSFLSGNGSAPPGRTSVIIDVSPPEPQRALAKLPPVIVFNGPRAVEAIEQVLKDLPLDHSSEEVNPFAEEDCVPSHGETP